MQICKVSWEGHKCNSNQLHKELQPLLFNVLRQVLLSQIWNKVTQTICPTKWILSSHLKIKIYHLKDLDWAKCQTNNRWIIHLVYNLRLSSKPLLFNRGSEVEQLSLLIILVNKMFLKALIKGLRNLLYKTRSLEIYLTMMMKIWEFSQTKAFLAMLLLTSYMRMWPAISISWNTLTFRNELTLWSH
jgi:hypothetical protein